MELANDFFELELVLFRGALSWCFFVIEDGVFCEVEWMDGMNADEDTAGCDRVSGAGCV